MKYTLQGQVTIEGGEPEMPLYAHVEAGNQVVDGFSITQGGRFKETIESLTPPDAIRFLAFDNTDSGVILTDTHRAPLQSTGWQQVNGTQSQQVDAEIPWELVNRWGNRVLKEFSVLGFLATYQMKGRVVTRTANGQVQGIPNARVEFLEYDPRRKRWWQVPSDPSTLNFVWSAAERRDTLGVVWTDAQGNFDFSFRWNLLHFPSFPPTPTDPAPDIILRIGQNVDGQSVQLLETEPFMSLEKGKDLGNIEVPIEKVLLLPNPNLSSNLAGFHAIGLLPVDRIQDGYANSQAGDLVSCKNAPFGGNLEVYAWTQKDPRVTHYRLSHAPAGTTQFEDVADALRNYVFDSTNKTWKGVSLGPATVGGVDNLYRSIEGQSGYLFDSKLKARWSTGDLKPGKYTLRFEGFQLDPATGTATPVPSATFTLDLRIDNVRPTAQILGLYKVGETDPQTECGIIDLRSNPKQPLRVKIYVQDPEGHLGRWQLNTSFGRNHNAGKAFTESEDYRSLQNSQVLWAGPGETEVTLPGTASDPWHRCAYAFHLHAVGRSTDGRSSYLRSQETRFQLNTYIDA